MHWEYLALIFDFFIPSTIILISIFKFIPKFKWKYPSFLLHLDSSLDLPSINSFLFDSYHKMKKAINNKSCGKKYYLYIKSFNKKEKNKKLKISLEYHLRIIIHYYLLSFLIKVIKLIKIIFF